MKVIVKPHKIKIELEHDYNSGEYNVQECNFEFSDEYTGLSKVVIFSNSSVTKEIQIYNDRCIVPAEVLQNEGVVGIGVYGYEVSGDELTLRYSPKPQCFPVEKGSYAEGTQPAPPTPSVVEQLQQQITNNANNISSLQDLTALHGEQIETNANDISAIKSEQTTQNNKIQANTEEIESINGIIPTLAKKTEIPTKVSQLENDSNYVTETEMSNAIDEEKTERENADIELQSQIDAITVSPDVVDVVGTYQELLDYDTSKLTDDDIIKVLVDSTHNDALSYYRWQITGGIGSWQYIGSEGPFYTKSETNSLLNEKQDEITNDNKLDSDLVRDDGQTNKFVTVQEKTTWNNKQDALTFDNTPTENSDNPVKSGGIYDFVNTKLEDYVLETDFEESQSLQDDEIARNKMIYNAMPKVSGEGTDLTLNNTAKCPVYDIESSPSELEQETTNGYQLFNKNGRHYDVGVNVTTLDTGIRVTLTQASNYRNTAFVIGGSELLGKTITQKTVITPSASNVGAFYIFLGNANSTSVERIIGTASGDNTRQFPIPSSFPENCDTVYMICYGNTTGESQVGDYVDYTDLMITEGAYTSTTMPEYEPYTYGASPNPQYPQQIHTVSGENEIKVQNKNLFDLLNLETIAIGSVGSVYRVLTSNSDYVGYILNVENLTNLTISRKNTTDFSRFRFGFTNEKPVQYTLTYNENWANGMISRDNWTSVTLTIPSQAKYLVMYLSNTSETITSSSELQVEINSTKTTYVPHQEQTYPLSLADLEYCKIGDYEDEFYKATESDTGLTAGKWYLKKNIGKVVLNGSESGWLLDTGSTAQFGLRKNDLKRVNSQLMVMSDYFKGVTYSSSWNAYNYLISTNTSTSSAILIKIKYPDISTLEDFKTWLSEHNPTVYYVLATPENILLSDTLQTQLDNIQKALSYQEQTNVSQTNNDLPFVIKMSAIRDLSGIFELIQ